MSQPQQQVKKTEIHVDLPSQNPAIASLQQLGKGNLPSNEQMTQVLDKTQEFIEETKQQKVPVQTEKVLKDTEQLIESTKEFLEHKNPDEKFQKFVTESSKAVQEVAQASKQEIKKTAQAPDQKEKVKEIQQEARRAGDAALSVIKSMMTNGEFRMFLVDLVTLAHDIFLQNFQKSQMKEGQQQQQPPYKQGFTAATPSTTTSTTQPQEWQVEIPQETKHELSYRFITLLRRINSNPNFTQGVRNLFDALDDLCNEAKRVAQNIKEPLEGNCHSQAAYEEGKKILHELSGRDPDQLVQQIKDFAREVQNDQRMHNWLDKLKQLCNEVIKNPYLLDEYQLVRRCEDLIDEGRQLLKDNKWRERYQRILDECRALFDAIKQDPDIQKLGESAQKLLENFTWVDANGQRHFNTELAGQIRHYLVPLFLKYLEHIPLPTISGSTEDYDFKFDNINFSGTDILPDHVEVLMRSHLDINVPKLEAEKVFTQAFVKITDIRTKMEGVKFWFKRKVMPKLEDEGIADVDLAGDGAKITLLLRLSGGSERGLFHVTKVDVDIDKLKINIREAKHQMLLNMVTTLFQGRIKRQIENQIETSTRNIFTDIENGINELINKYPPSKLADLAKEQLGIASSSPPESSKPAQTFAQSKFEQQTKSQQISASS